MRGETVGVTFCLLLQQVGFTVNVMSAVLPALGIMAGFISLNLLSWFVQEFAGIWPNTWGANTYIFASIASQGLRFVCDTSREDGDDGTLTSCATTNWRRYT
jgi:hypothetical protein